MNVVCTQKFGLLLGEYHNNIYNTFIVLYKKRKAGWLNRHSMFLALSLFKYDTSNKHQTCGLSPNGCATEKMSQNGNNLNSNKTLCIFNHE